jgi:hypothetical protein
MSGGSRPPKTPASIRRWDSSTASEQLATVREVCGTRGKALLKSFDGGLAVGAGFKKSANEVSDEICLGVLVQRKVEEPHVRPIPKRVEVFLIRGGKRTKFSIPTDVEELGDGEPHAGLNLAQGVRAFHRTNAGQGVPGAVCCIVADTSVPPNHYVLGCRHVLALSLLTSGCAAFNATDVADRAMTTRFAELHATLPMAANGQPCLDAAISMIHPGSQVGWLAPGNVRALAIEPGVQQPSNCLVYTPNGPLPAIFVKEWANVPLPYPSCGNVVIAAAYQFKSPTQGGHSGSPVMTLQGLLFGMHFWGDTAKQIAFAIPAFVLFQPGLFSLNFHLV